MGEGVFVGIDLGTTGCKMILIHEEGTLLDSAYIEYPIVSLLPGFAEQDPDLWWRGLCEISQTLMAKNEYRVKNLLGIGICGQMHTQVYLDRNNHILRNAITWMDQRSKGLVEELSRDARLKQEVFQHTANHISTTYTAPNILWVKRNEPDIYQKTAKVLLAKDYIKYRLTGQMVTDYSDAVGTLLFDAVGKKWSPEMFDLFGIRSELIPEAVCSSQIIGHISSDAFLETGLPQGLPVINGCADQAATSLGSGVCRNGQVTAIVGTAGVVSTCSDKPLPDMQGRTSCWNYCLDDKWVILGVMQTAAESLHWFKNAFEKDKESSSALFEIYNREVAKIPDGSEGLIFLPYLMGERTPHWDADARGVFYGISINHHKYHFIRAVMEGVGFGLKDNLESIESLGIAVTEMRLLGGGSKNLIWRDIMAKILQKRLITIKVPENGALGCSILCGMALGIYSDVESAISKLVKVDSEMYHRDGSPVYQKNYQIYKELYCCLKDLYKKSTV
ncbi:MAG TPA: xylulokinase [Firmicutes bacterium]|jgi:xylulokinase|nr:xylulokinase [Bacillota bacterium]